MIELSNGWRRVAFGDVAINSTVVSADPEAEGFERYIIGKHIPEDADRIETWGPVGDSDFGPRIRTIFQPGDVICTTRGPKLKVARVEFRGLGAHTNFYLRTADPEVLMQGYLEAVVRSHGFQQHLVNNFRGSVNLFVNWSDAAKYEFALPPLEKQQRTVSVLQAEQVLRERMTLAHNALNAVSDSWIESRLASNEWPEAMAADVLDRATVGIVVKPAALYVPEGTGVPALRSLNIAPHRLLMNDCVNISSGGHRDHKKSRLEPGDLVIVRSGRPGDAAVIPDGLGELNCIDLIIATPGKRLRSEFLCAVLNSRFGRRQFASGIAGTAQKHFNVGLFKKLRIPIPPLKTQDDFISHMRQLQNAAVSFDRRRHISANVCSRMLEEVLNP